MKKVKTILCITISLIIFLLCSCNSVSSTVDEPKQSTGPKQSTISRSIPTEKVEIEKEENVMTDITAEADMIENENANLTGFWHSAPDFSEGFQTRYMFYDDGGVDYISGDGTHYWGKWSLNESGVLMLEPYEHEYENKIPKQNYNIDYIAEDAVTGKPAMLINDQKFWKLYKPQDVINGLPFYVAYDFDYYSEGNSTGSAGTDGKNVKSLKTIGAGGSSSDASESIIISYEGDIYDFKIFTVGNDEEHSWNFYFKDEVFSIGELPSDFVILYTTSLAERIPFEAISFTDGNGKRYTYLLGYNGHDGSVYASPTENISIPGDSVSGSKVDSNKTENHNKKLTNLETVTLKFYWYDWDNEVSTDYYDERNYQNKTEVIQGENLLEETIRFMDLYSDIKIKNIWYEGTKVCVDLKAVEGYMFNAGSASGAIRTNILLLTFSGYPDAEEIEILVDGKRGYSADHFNFDKIFKLKNGTLEESQK